jgi:RsiW-degrading membrane proteinase PrsW (M82 family)
MPQAIEMEEQEEKETSLSPPTSPWIFNSSSSSSSRRNNNDNHAEANADNADKKNLGHWVTSVATLIFIIIGFSVNASPSPQETVSLGPSTRNGVDCSSPSALASPSLSYQQWIQMMSDASNGTLPMHQALIITASILLPASPLLLNSKTVFNEGKQNALVAHILGQSASFGSTEMARHFLVAPNWQFFSHCNLSLAECQRMPPGEYLLTAAVAMTATATTYTASAAAAPKDDNDDNDNSTTTTADLPRAEVLCPRPTVGPFKDLYDSLHSLPDFCSALIGSSTIIFVSNLWFWDLSNKSNKPVAATHNFTKLILVCVFIFYVTLSMFYRFRYVENSFGELIFSFIYGAGIQIFITLLYQSQSQH